jgi:2-dehydropantoate 2-reductase
MTDSVNAWVENARIVVFGCGGIGGIVASRLAQAGRNVVVVTGNQAITEAVAQSGLTAHLPDGVARSRIDVVTHPRGASARGRFDVALLAVPPNRLAAAASDAHALLADDGIIVPLANGLPEELLVDHFAALAGDDMAGRIIGAIVGFGGTAMSPGVIEQTSDGGFTIGRLNGVVDAPVRRLGALLGRVSDDVDGPSVVLTGNLRGARWSKLAINCAISSLGTIGGDRLGALMRHRFVRRLSLEVMTEATQVALTLGVKLEKLSGMIDLEWFALDPDERLASGSPGLLAKHTALLAVGARYRRLRSSMLSAIERGREPPVDELNGEVVRRAALLGLPVPVNAAVVDLVKRIGRGQAVASLATLEHLFADTRVSLRALRMAA